MEWNTLPTPILTRKFYNLGFKTLHHRIQNKNSVDISAILIEGSFKSRVDKPKEPQISIRSISEVSSNNGTEVIFRSRFASVGKYRITAKYDSSVICTHIHVSAKDYKKSTVTTSSSSDDITEDQDDDEENNILPPPVHEDDNSSNNNNNAKLPVPLSNTNSSHHSNNNGRKSPIFVIIENSTNLMKNADSSVPLPLALSTRLPVITSITPTVIAEGTNQICFIGHNLTMLSDNVSVYYYLLCPITVLPVKTRLVSGIPKNSSVIVANLPALVNFAGATGDLTPILNSCVPNPLDGSKRIPVSVVVHDGDVPILAPQTFVYLIKSKQKQ